MAEKETTAGKTAKGNIFIALNAVMCDIDAIGKNQKNQSQGFMYRGIDVVMNVLKPLFAKHGVIVVPQVLEQTREERTTKSGGNVLYSILKIKFNFFAMDGSSVEAITVGEGMDSGDKASNKAMSIAFKYAAFQVLCIPTEEMKDPDEVTPEASKPTMASEEQVARMIDLKVNIGGVQQKFKVKELKDLTQEQADFVITTKVRAMAKAEATEAGA